MGRKFRRWLVLPLWQVIRYAGKFGRPDKLGFVSLASQGHAPRKQKVVPITNSLTAAGPDNWQKSKR